MMNGKFNGFWQWLGGLKSILALIVGGIVMGAMVLPLAQQNREDIVRGAVTHQQLTTQLDYARRELVTVRVEIRWLGLLVCDGRVGSVEEFTPDRVLRTSIASWCDRVAEEFLAPPPPIVNLP